MRVDFSEYFSLTYNETCVVHSSVGDAGAGGRTGARNVTEFVRAINDHLQGSVESAEVLAGLSTNRGSVERVQIDGNVSGTQVPATAACYLGQRGRVEQSSREWSVVSDEVVHALNPTAGGWESLSHTSVWSAKETEPMKGFPFERWETKEASWPDVPSFRRQRGACAADAPMNTRTGLAQSRVSSQRPRLAPTEEDIFMTLAGRRC